MSSSKASIWTRSLPSRSFGDRSRVVRRATLIVAAMALLPSTLAHADGTVSCGNDLALGHVRVSFVGLTVNPGTTSYAVISIPANGIAMNISSQAVGGKGVPVTSLGVATNTSGTTFYFSQVNSAAVPRTYGLHVSWCT